MYSTIQCIVFIHVHVLWGCPQHQKYLHDGIANLLGGGGGGVAFEEFSAHSIIKIEQVLKQLRYCIINLGYYRKTVASFSVFPAPALSHSHVFPPQFLSHGHSCKIN